MDTAPLSGISKIMTATPARADGPRICQRKYIARMTCKGTDHSRLMKGDTSMKRWASTDMRLTISPTVDLRLAELVMTRAFL